jgi:hypothetical protein
MRPMLAKSPRGFYAFRVSRCCDLVSAESVRVNRSIVRRQEPVKTRFLALFMLSVQGQPSRNPGFETSSEARKREPSLLEERGFSGPVAMFCV